VLYVLVAMLLAPRPLLTALCVLRAPPPRMAAQLSDGDGLGQFVASTPPFDQSTDETPVHVHTFGVIRKHGAPAALDVMTDRILNGVRMLAATALVALTLQAGTPAAYAALPPGKLATTVPELVRIVTEDLTERRYLVTGELTPSVYADDAHFADSNNDFGNGLSKWVRGVKALFISDRCRVALTGPVVADEAKRTITFTGWRQVDVFRLPGAPHTPVFTGKTYLTLDPIENLIVDHTEVWDQSPEEIKRDLKFFDSAFDPPGFQ